MERKLNFISKRKFFEKKDPLGSYETKFFQMFPRNYDSEIFAFAHRLNENFKESLLRQAMIHPSYVIAQSKLKELG